MTAVSTSDPRLLQLEQVLNIDSSFSPHRPHLTSQDDEETLYVKWRKILLYRQLKANKILHNEPGDRRTDYLIAREKILSSKFPSRNRTRRPNDGYDNQKHLFNLLLLEMSLIKATGHLFYFLQNCFCSF